MTRLLAHAITRRSTGGPSAGLRGQPLEQVLAADLGLWATQWSGEPILTRDDAFAHHDLVAVLCDAEPCLPIRFGTWLADETAARRTLESGQERFTTALDRLGGRREVAITLLWRDAPSPEGRGHAVAPSGRAFLERRRTVHAVTAERRQAADALASRLRAALTADQADARHESCPSAEVALSMSLLTRSDQAEALKARAAAEVSAIDGVRGVVSGPWPPYSFTEELGGVGGR